MRLRHRYLDLRRPEMARAIRLRAEVNRLIREVMDAHDFLDVETPYLTRSTPEGARDFLVPVRLQPGHWYALPQSPQLFKQLLMVAGLERYYQIARCFRDEDFRADRQPEFTQLDVEMSFVDTDDVIALTEEVLVRLWRDVLGHEIDDADPADDLRRGDAPVRHRPARPALRLRAGRLHRLLRATRRSACSSARATTGTSAPWSCRAAPRSPASSSTAGRSGPGPAAPRASRTCWCSDDGELGGPVAKNLSEAERDGLAAHAGAQPGDCVFFAAGTAGRGPGPAGGGPARGGGAVRSDRPRPLGVLLGRRRADVRADRRRTARAGPRSTTRSPHRTAEYAADFHDRPGRGARQAYDIVLNGIEIGGGSIRIHRSEMQQRVFDVIGLSREEARSQFGFLLDAFAYGPPPHGGIALGLDRLCALLAGSTRSATSSRSPRPRRAATRSPVRRRPSPQRSAARPGSTPYPTTEQVTGSQRPASVPRSLPHGAQTPRSVRLQSDSFEPSLARRAGSAQADEG